jgi:hypothetical protein
MKFTRAHINLMSWTEFGELTELLFHEVAQHFERYGQEIDVIAPLLRTGGIIGGIMGIRAKIIPTLPIQLKYSYNPTNVNQIISLPEFIIKGSNEPKILLCEGNTNSGGTAKRAALLIKQRYPQAKIFLATLTKVFGGPEKLEGIEKIFYGRLTDENFCASEEERDKYSLRRGITIFPWEDAQSELNDINSAQG